MEDYKMETEKRVAFIREILKGSGLSKLVFGNSGGKDCALAGILCKLACADTLSVMLPCTSKRNYTVDREDGQLLCDQFQIENITVDMTPAKDALVEALRPHTELSDLALANIGPRLRMNALYAIGASQGRLVVGTGNRSERYMGYFTKWGDGGCDFNPIGDLTVAEVYGFLDYFHAPKEIIKKAPSAALFEGQTDEDEMGVTYASIDRFLTTGITDEADLQIIGRYHGGSHHKRKMPTIYGEG